MTKRLIFLIGIFIITAVFLIRLIQIKNNQANQKPRINIHASYDEPVFGSDIDNAKVEELTTKSVDNDTTQLLQTFKSGQVMAINLPSSPVASSSALKQNSTKGIQIASDDYYATIFHIVKLDNANEMCKVLADNNAHTNLYVREKKPLKTNATTSTLWGLVNQQETGIEQVNACYADGKNKVWIVDFYINLKNYPKYNDKMVSILNSFAFTR